MRRFNLFLNAKYVDVSEPKASIHSQCHGKEMIIICIKETRHVFLVCVIGKMEGTQGCCAALLPV